MRRASATAGRGLSIAPPPAVAGKPVGVRTVQASLPAPDLTGFRLMPLGAYSLDARIQLAQRARYSLDVQYYLIQDDRTGRLILRTLRDAALRGVRVRAAGGRPLHLRRRSALHRARRRFRTSRCACSTRSSRTRIALSSKFTALPPTSGGSIIGCTTSCSSPTARSPSRAGATSPTSTSCASATDNFIDFDPLVVGNVVPQLARQLRPLLEQPAGLSSGDDHPTRASIANSCSGSSTSSSTKASR